MRDLLARIAGRCVERPAPVLAATVLVVLVGAVAALRLQVDAGTDQIVDRDSDAYVATQQFKEKFGDDAVVVLAEGDLKRLLLTQDLGKLLSLEGCCARSTSRSSSRRAAPMSRRSAGPGARGWPPASRRRRARRQRRRS